MTQTARTAFSPGLLGGFGGTAGFGENILNRNDDGSTGFIEISSVFEEGMNFFGTVYEGFFINNNGSITFISPRSAYTPNVITGISNNPEITPFFGDVDTRNGTDIGDPTEGGNSTGSNLVYWHFDTINDRIIITWDDVGYYSSNNSLLNAFQLIITDVGSGDFDFEFRYEDINWTTGSASGGSGGLGGTPARAGWTAGTGEAGEFFELPASGVQDQILTLEDDIGNTGLTGIWQFSVRNGGVVESIVPRAEIEAGAWVTGDPHLLTLDGLNYSFQAVGEYVLLRSTRSGYDLEVQARFVPASADNVSETEAIATAIDGISIEVNASLTGGTHLLVDGVATTVTDFGFVDVGTGRVYREGDTYYIVYPGSNGTIGAEDTQIAVTVRGGRLDMNFSVATEILGDLEGLLGDGNGLDRNDLQLADGTVISPDPTFEELYGQFRDDWQVTTAAESFFTYGSGEGPLTHYDPDYPGSIITLDDLDPAVRASAETAAMNAGLIPGTPNFENAVLDFALTGDATYIESAASTPISFADGTEGDDSIDGNGNDNRILSLGGNDTVNAGDGVDTVRAGLGNDLVEAGEGNDSVWADGGNDTVNGDDGNDFLRGGRGFDSILGGEGDDSLRGQRQADELFGQEGDDNLNGGGGGDTVRGGIGDDFIKGGTKADRLFGEDDDDTINGNRHDDLLFGGGGNDSLNGGGDNDTLVGGLGDDWMRGGEGEDEFAFYDSEAGNDTIDDFDVTEDVLAFDGALTNGASAADLVAGATVTADGVLFEFADDAMTILLEGLTTKDGLVDAIDSF